MGNYTLALISSNWVDRGGSALTCERQLHYEEIHSRLPSLADHESDDHGRVSQHDQGEQDPENGELLRLKEKIQPSAFRQTFVQFT